MDVRVVLVALSLGTLACSGAPAPSSGSVREPPVAADAVPSIDRHARQRFPRDEASKLPYWRSAGPWEGPWSEPVSAGIDEQGWTWFAYDAADLDGLRDAWVRAIGAPVVWRSADGRELWVDKGAAIAGLRTALEDGRAVVRLRLWFQEVPGEMPKDPFCPDDLRPDFAYGEDGAVVQRGCRTVGERSDAAGPVEIVRDGAILRGTRKKYDLDGEVSVSVGDRVVASGRYAKGRPDGEWRYGDTIVTWRDGRPDPIALDGILRGDAAVGFVSASRLEVLDVDLERGVAWRLVYETELPEVDVPVRVCKYPGLKPTEGVKLGLSDVVARTASTWDVYASVGGEDPCTTDAEATTRLAEAKAAFAGAGLDPSRRPAALQGVDGRFDLGDGHVLTVVETQDPPPFAEQFTPWLHPGAPYEEDLAGDHESFYRFDLDGRDVWRTTFYVSASCAGRGKLSWDSAYRQGDRVILQYTAMTGGCTGESWSYGFSPVFTL